MARLSIPFTSGLRLNERCPNDIAEISFNPLYIGALVFEGIALPNCVIFQSPLHRGLEDPEYSESCRRCLLSIPFTSGHSLCITALQHLFSLSIPFTSGLLYGKDSNTGEEIAFNPLYIGAPNNNRLGYKNNHKLSIPFTSGQKKLK